ncbi:hypothetical protein AX17_002436 [Amanita inopinata Kibby_2008]|nr:hypothetical protein AX17_002436 [Amanita inopinata Kibby_2008]
MADSQPQAAVSSMQQEMTRDYGRSIIHVSYKLASRSRLKIFLNSFANFFRQMSQSNTTMIPLDIRKDAHIIGAFVRSLELLYTRPQTQHISFDCWKVVKVVTYKNPGMKARHEYIVATMEGSDIKNPDTKGPETRKPNLVHLKVQRRIRDSATKKLFRWSKGATNNGATSTSGASPPGDDSGAANAPGNPTQNPPPQLKMTVSTSSIFMRITNSLFPSLPFSPALSILLPPSMSFLAFVSTEALKRLCPDSVGESGPKKKSQGRWNQFPANIFYQDFDVDALIAEYESQWQEFEDGIKSTINNPNNELYQDERNKPIKAEQRAAEIAAEKDKQAEDERRKRVEAEQEIKRLQAMLAEAQARAGPSVTSTCKIYLRLTYDCNTYG